MVRIVSCLGLSVVAAAAVAGAAPGRGHRGGLLPPARPVPLVVLLRRPGLRTYEKVVEEFRGGVRAEVRVLATRPLPLELPAGADQALEHEAGELRGWLRRTRPNLVFAIGQSAYDLASRVGLPVPLLHVLAYHCRQAPGHWGIDSWPAAQAVMLAFAKARPGIGTVAVLHGPRSAGVLRAAREAASEQGIEVLALAARSPAEAVRRLRRMLSSGKRRTQGLWLLPDLQLLTPQVFQFAVRLQFRQRLPLMAVTQVQVSQGALMAMDVAPDVLGRQAAALANSLLGARGKGGVVRPRRQRRYKEGADLYRATTVRLSVNRVTARRIGVLVARLKPLAPEVVQ